MDWLCFISYQFIYYSVFSRIFNFSHWIHRPNILSGMVQISQLFSRCTDRKSFVHLNTHVLLCQLNLINMTSFSITPLCFVSLNLDTNETWLNSVNFGNNADFLQNGWNRVNLGEKVRYLVNLKTQNAWLNLIKCSKTGENPAMTSSQLAI